MAKQEENITPVGRSALTQWSSGPFSLLRRLSEDMERLFEDFTSPARSWVGESLMPGSQRSRGWSPQIEMFQREDNLVIRADLPGLSKEDLDLRVEDNRLCISGERRQGEGKETKEGVYLSERSYGSFCRCVELPHTADPEKVSATFRDGVLEIIMPISEEVRGKPITIH